MLGRIALSIALTVALVACGDDAPAPADICGTPSGTLYACDMSGVGSTEVGTTCLEYRGLPQNLREESEAACTSGGGAWLTSGCPTGANAVNQTLFGFCLHLAILEGTYEYANYHYSEMMGFIAEEQCDDGDGAETMVWCPGPAYAPKGDASCEGSANAASDQVVSCADFPTGAEAGVIGCWEWWDLATWEAQSFTGAQVASVIGTKADFEENCTLSGGTFQDGVPCDREDALGACVAPQTLNSPVSAIVYTGVGTPPSCGAPGLWCP
jgi:hypothetical protein